MAVFGGAIVENGGAGKKAVCCLEVMIPDLAWGRWLEMDQTCRSLVLMGSLAGLSVEVLV